MDWLEGIGGFLDKVPAHLQTLVLFVLLFSLYQYAQVKWIAPKTNGNGIAKLREEITNHLTTALEKNTEALETLERTARDQTEELHRVANSMNVVMGKQDNLRESMIRLEAKSS